MNACTLKSGVYKISMRNIHGACLINYGHVLQLEVIITWYRFILPHVSRVMVTLTFKMFIEEQKKHRNTHYLKSCFLIGI